MAPLMVHLPPALPISYPIWLAADNLYDIHHWMPSTTLSQVVIITDEHVRDLYGHTLNSILQKAGYTTLLLTIPPGERAKTRRQKARLEKAMLEAGCDRQTLILALGGGVVGDLAGFVAATYLRGISFIQMPTTLLAMVDSAVGGKTAIDTPQGKNMIGAFWQPQAVVADVSCLVTLPLIHRMNGLLEAVKMFLTDDATSVAWFNENVNALLAGDKLLHIEAIKRAVSIKIQTVVADERDKGRRMVLNFGHTIGHALENVSQYTWLHGYAVGVGMLVEAMIAVLLNRLSQTNYLFIAALLKHLGVEGHALASFDVEAIIAATLQDKKTQAGYVHYVILQDMGAVFVEAGQFTHAVPAAIVKEALYVVRGEGYGG